MLRYFWPSDDEQLAGQWQDSHFDEDGGWWANVQQCGATLALAVGLSLAASSTAAATSVFSQSQDDPAGNLVSNAIPQEEYYQNPVAPVNWPQPAVITYDDTHVAFVEVFQTDEDFWQNPVPPIPATNYLRLPFQDPEEIPVGSFPTPTNPLDDGGLWAPQIPPQEVDWNVLLFLDDASWVPAMQPDEDFWYPQIPPANWPQPQQPFAASDEDQFVQQFVADEQYWQNGVAPVQASLALLQPFAFEQNEQAANLVGFTDEVFWQNPVAPVPASMWVLRQDAFEQHDANGNLTLVLDDGFQPNFVPPVPGSLALLQQWTFDQNESPSLYAIHDEDFWQNQVPPVNWSYPLPFVYDDVIASVPNTGEDEDLWSQFVAPSVPPVPPSMFLRFPYLPEPEEIPAGTLAPPVPPLPPPFCPLPPTGPDADTSMSTFSNFKGGPVLALFCRICNSGKPLVVRADYAIWCQDCCAFISKQDTYMGTVRAPGQFKGVF